MKQQVARLLFPYGSRRVVLRGPARGMRFVVQDGMGFSYAIGDDRAIPRHFARMISPSATVLDVGANCGQSALLFSCLVGPNGRVISFEPAPNPFGKLVENVDVSGCFNVETHQIALSDACGTAEFRYSDQKNTSGKLAGVEPTNERAGWQSFEVQTATLDSLVDGGTVPTPDFLKIDVEGAGAAVLRGARGVLAAHSPTVFIELHGPKEQAGVRDELVGRGYVVETLDGERVADPAAAWRSPLYCYRPA